MQDKKTSVFIIKYQENKWNIQKKFTRANSPRNLFIRTLSCLWAKNCSFFSNLYLCIHKLIKQQQEDDVKYIAAWNEWLHRNASGVETCTFGIWTKGWSDTSGPAFRVNFLCLFYCSFSMYFFVDDALVLQLWYICKQYSAYKKGSQY